MTNGLEAALRGAALSLDSLGARWCLVGGVAVAARAEPRFTRDVDFAVSVSDDGHAERLVRDLQDLGYAAVTSVEHDVTKRLAAVRLKPPGQPALGVVIDLLFASSGIEPEIVAASEDLEIMPGLHAHVARVGHLIALKLLAADDDRPQDTSDVRVLRSVASQEDAELAHSAIRLIQERGYARGRDLNDALIDALNDR